jgi:hypothetical protein
MVRRAKYEAIKTSRPVFLTGDFNSPPTGQDGGAYQITTGTLAPVPINATFEEKYSWKAKDEKPFGLVDLAVKTQPRYRSGNYATCTGFSAVGDTKKYYKLDYVFGGSTGVAWGVEGYHVGSSLYDNGSWNR